MKAIVTLSRDTKLNGWETHKTPKAVAEYMRAEGSDVGRKYKTHGDIWDADATTLQTGLLHLILDQLEKVTVDKDAEIERHREWLLEWHTEVTNLIRKQRKECTRIEKFCRLELLGRDVSAVDPNEFSMAYRCSWSEHWQRLHRLKARVERLKKVKSLADITELAGIGESAASRIKAKMEESK